MERHDPYTPKEPAHIRRTTPREVIEELAGPPDKEDATCRHGSGVLINDDLPIIAGHLGITEDHLKKRYLEPITKFNTTLHRPKLRAKPVGACVFYDEKKGCTINTVKPYQCRIASRNHHGERIIEWFDANFFLDPKDPASLREWASRSKFKKTIPGASIEELVPDKATREQLLRGEHVRL